MSDSVFDTAPPVAATSRLSVVSAILRRALSGLTAGTLTIVLPNRRHLTIQGRDAGPEGVVILHRWRVLRRLVGAGDIGFAEAYMDGEWTSPDLTALIELTALNQAAIPGADGGLLLSRLAGRLRHLARPNTIAGSRRNITQHYDLGNDFYATWLDAGMSYSSAMFTRSDMSLEAAQTAKQDRVLDLLELTPGQTVLEVGIGWGGLAERLAQAGGEVTGLTLSPAQHGYAVDRLANAGLAADLRLQDYRHVAGQFDRIVSIEMLEAVGESWWPVYFDTLRQRLARDGTIVLQTITITDERFPLYRRNVDFIQRHIFPGGLLPAPGVLREQIERAGLQVRAVESFGQCYAETLRLWRERFDAAWPSIARQGFAPRFKRMWEYYLAYCEGGFRAGAVDVGLWQLGHRA